MSPPGHHSAGAPSDCLGGTDGGPVNTPANASVECTAAPITAARRHRVTEELEYASARYREARDIANSAESTARRAKSTVQTAERLLAHHLSVLVEQGGQWAATPAEGTTLACAQWAVAQWEEARAAEVVANVTADRAVAHVNDLWNDLYSASRAR